MKYYLILLIALCGNIIAHAGDIDSNIVYKLDDSIRAVSFTSDINVQSTEGKKEVAAGIRTNMVSLFLESKKNKKQIVFGFPKYAKIMASGLGTDKKRGKLKWDYDWNTNENYRLLIAVATDSASNFALYSAYVLLPKEMKWKLIGSCKISGQWNAIKQPATLISGKKSSIQASVSNTWIQRANGSWKNLDGNEQSAPLLNLVSHVDSVQQIIIDQQIIGKAMRFSQTDITDSIEGVYYKIINPGTGNKVSVTDTVTVHYKGYLFGSGEIFDQTRNKPATFPLNRLIKGWQLVIPLLKVGGKIKIVIPSSQAYSIRPRAAKIPPNSILVFEVEVLDAKPPMNR
ncbi:MAG: FKBP-type peptidyl-prolyl cis-trans isomerase [Flavisolibacter sp.]